MAVVTQDYATGVARAFKRLYANTLMAQESRMAWRRITRPESTPGKESGSYNWFGSSPAIVDVTEGTGVRRGLRPFNFVVTNREYQNILEISIPALERDELNQIRPRIAGLAKRMAAHPGKLIMELFESNPAAYDGTAFFADTRVIGDSANIDNLLAPAMAGADPTVGELQTALALCAEAMYLFEDDEGEPMEVIGDVIVCHPRHTQTWWQALNRSQGDGVISPTPEPAAMGTFNGSGYTVLTNPYLTDAQDFYLLHAMGEETPFLLQTEAAPRLMTATNPDSEFAIENRALLYSSYGRYAVAVTDPRFAVKAVMT